MHISCSAGLLVKSRRRSARIHVRARQSNASIQALLGQLNPPPAHFSCSSATCYIPAVVCSKRITFTPGASWLPSCEIHEIRPPTMEPGSTTAAAVSRSSVSARPPCGDARRQHEKGQKLITDMRRNLIVLPS
jgi:hypothetical protein